MKRLRLTGFPSGSLRVFLDKSSLFKKKHNFSILTLMCSTVQLGLLFDGLACPGGAARLVELSVGEM